MRYSISIPSISQLLMMVLIAVLGFGTFSSCTVQKRVHRKGWFIQWHTNKSSNVQNKENKISSQIEPNTDSQGISPIDQKISISTANEHDPALSQDLIKTNSVHSTKYISNGKSKDPKELKEDDSVREPDNLDEEPKETIIEPPLRISEALPSLTGAIIAFLVFAIVLGILMLLLVGLITILGGTIVAPYIYLGFVPILFLLTSIILAIRRGQLYQLYLQDYLREESVDTDSDDSGQNRKNTNTAAFAVMIIMLILIAVIALFFLL